MSKKKFVDPVETTKQDLGEKEYNRRQEEFRTSRLFKSKEQIQEALRRLDDSMCGGNVEGVTYSEVRGTIECLNETFNSDRVHIRVDYYGGNKYE